MVATHEKSPSMPCFLAILEDSGSLPIKDFIGFLPMVSFSNLVFADCHVFASKGSSAKDLALVLHTRRDISLGGPTYKCEGLEFATNWRSTHTSCQRNTFFHANSHSVIPKTKQSLMGVYQR